MSDIINITKFTLNALQGLWSYKSLTPLTKPSCKPHEIEVSIRVPLKVADKLKEQVSYAEPKAQTTKYFITPSIPEAIMVTLEDVAHFSDSKWILKNEDEAFQYVATKALKQITDNSTITSNYQNRHYHKVDISIAPSGVKEYINKNFSNVVDSSAFSTARKSLDQQLTQQLYDKQLHDKQIKQFEWDNWLPVKLAKASIFNYLSNKAMKFIDIYSNSKDISEAGGKFVQSLGTVDESGIVIPKIQHKLLDLTKSYILDSQLLGKVIVEVTDILFSPIKPVDSLAHTAYTVVASAYTGVASLMGEGTNTHPDDVVVPKLA